MDLVQYESRSISEVLDAVVEDIRQSDEYADAILWNENASFIFKDLIRLARVERRPTASRPADHALATGDADRVVVDKVAVQVCDLAVGVDTRIASRNVIIADGSDDVRCHKHAKQPRTGYCILGNEIILAAFDPDRRVETLEGGGQ